MTYWHLLWMFGTVLVTIALGLAVPFAWEFAWSCPDYAIGRQYDWRRERRRRRQVELYGQLLRGCFYCGSVCEFGPNCENYDLAQKAGAA